jgi:hypothetical protein
MQYPPGPIINFIATSIRVSTGTQLLLSKSCGNHCIKTIEPIDL